VVTELVIDVRPRDDKGRHLVIAQHGPAKHTHRFDVDSQFHRKQFREAVVSKFGLDEDAHGWIEEHLVTKAAAVDVSGDTALFTPVVTMLDTVTPQKVEWLWPNKIAIGKNNLLCGDPGLGKSLLALDIAARVSRGECFPDSRDTKYAPAGVVILTLEDDAADTLVPRLDAHEADRSRIAHVPGLSEADGDGNVIRGINLKHDLHAVRAVIERVQNCKLLIVDTISDYFGDDTDAHKNEEVRAVLNPLAALANEYRVANLLIAHGRKAEGKAVHCAMGSVAIVAQCRVAWLITRCPTNSRRRLITCVKNNLADDTSGLALAIEPYGPDNGPVICWETEPIRMSADQALDQLKRRPGPKPNKRQVAETWLANQLADGPMRADRILNAAETEGLNYKTVRRAFDELGCQRKKDGFDGGWFWSLPEDDTEDAQHHQTPKACPLGNLRKNTGEEDIKNCSRAKGTNSESARAFDTFEEERRELSNGHVDEVPF
jgi:hypothetical protein